MSRATGATSVLSLVGALLVATALPASASASTTLGSSLEDGYEATFGGTAGITVFQQGASGEALTVPANGLITSWSVRSGDQSAEYELRIVRPSAGAYTAVGTSAARLVPDSEDEVRGPFSVSLPVQAGDRIALDVIKGGGAPINNTLAPIADTLNYFGDPFADGTTEEPVLTILGGSQELLLQAAFVPGPVNEALPVISGEARAGTLLTATEGTWEHALSFGYQWARCALAVCSPIAGATGSTYTPTSEDEGQQLRLAVTATGEGGSATAYSELTAGVKPGPASAPTDTKPPEVTGEVRETETLTGTQGDWGGGPTVFEYQWLRCAGASGTGCAPVPGAAAAAYTLTHADVGSTMRLRVTAINAIGPTSVESAATAIVQPLILRARLAIHPDGSCTGVQTAIDASGSQTPNPPLHYQFTYVVFPDYLPALYGAGWESRIDEYPGATLTEGTNPTPIVTFTWNRRAESVLDARYLPFPAFGEYVRDPMRVTVTVTDGTGASATAQQVLYFADIIPGWAINFCPTAQFIVAPAKILSVKVASVTRANSVLSQIRCVTATPCVGAISLVSARAFAAAAGAASARRKPITIAANPFFSIPGKRTVEVRARLTKAGRALLKHNRVVKATVRLRSVTPTGSSATRSIAVTLHRR